MRLWILKVLIQSASDVVNRVNTSPWPEHTLDFISVNTGQNFSTVELQAC